MFPLFQLWDRQRESNPVILLTHATAPWQRTLMQMMNMGSRVPTTFAACCCASIWKNHETGEESLGLEGCKNRAFINVCNDEPSLDDEAANPDDLKVVADALKDFFMLPQNDRFACPVIIKHDWLKPDIPVHHCIPVHNIAGLLVNPNGEEDLETGLVTLPDGQRDENRQLIVDNFIPEQKMTRYIAALLNMTHQPSFNLPDMADESTGDNGSKNPNGVGQDAVAGENIGEHANGNPGGVANAESGDASETNGNEIVAGAVTILPQSASGSG